MGLPKAVLTPFAIAAGFRGPALTTIVAIGQAEGGGFRCNPDGPPACVSCGPWQIFFGASGTCEQTRELPLSHKKISRAYAATPLGSAKAAWEISDRGTNFNAWTTYTTSDPSRSYLQYMPGHKPVTVQGAGPGAGGGGCPAWKAAICAGPLLATPLCKDCRGTLKKAGEAVTAPIRLAAFLTDNLIPVLTIAGGAILGIVALALIFKEAAIGVGAAAVGGPEGFAAAQAMRQRQQAPARSTEESTEARSYARELGVQRARARAAQEETETYSREESERLTEGGDREFNQARYDQAVTRQRRKTRAA